MTVGVVIVTWNGERYVEDCLHSLVEQRVVPRHIVVVDNASSDSTRELAALFKDEATAKGATLTLLQESTNTGFTSAANRGMHWLLEPEPRVDVVVLLNQDAQLEPGWCTAVVDALEVDARIGAVGSRIFRPDGVTVQHAGGYLDRPRLVGKHWGDHPPVSNRVDTLADVEFVTAAAMAIRADALSEVGYFDEIFSPGYYEDVELCHRLHNSRWRVVYQPSAIATHVESASFSSLGNRLSLSHRNRLIYALPWLIDPSFREEFCLAERQAFTLASPIEEQRALRLAYLSMLLLMPEAMKSRVPSVIGTSTPAIELIDMFSQLREELVTPGAQQWPSDDAQPTHTTEIR